MGLFSTVPGCTYLAVPGCTLLYLALPRSANTTGYHCAGEGNPSSNSLNCALIKVQSKFYMHCKDWQKNYGEKESMQDGTNKIFPISELQIPLKANVYLCYVRRRG